MSSCRDQAELKPGGQSQVPASTLTNIPGDQWSASLEAVVIAVLGVLQGLDAGVAPVACLVSLISFGSVFFWYTFNMPVCSYSPSSPVCKYYICALKLEMVHPHPSWPCVLSFSYPLPYFICSTSCY